jgi:hypothetical protein
MEILNKQKEMLNDFGCFIKNHFIEIKEDKKIIKRSFSEGDIIPVIDNFKNYKLELNIKSKKIKIIDTKLEESLTKESANFFDAIKIIKNNVDNIFEFVKEQIINNKIMKYVSQVEIKFKNKIIPKLKIKYNERILNVKILCINKLIKNNTKKFISEMETKMYTLIIKNIEVIQSVDSYDIYIDETYKLESESEDILEFSNIFFCYTISLY